MLQYETCILYAWNKYRCLSNISLTFDVQPQGIPWQMPCLRLSVFWCISARTCDMCYMPKCIWKLSSICSCLLHITTGNFSINSPYLTHISYARNLHYQVSLLSRSAVLVVSGLNLSSLMTFLLMISIYMYLFGKSAKWESWVNIMIFNTAVWR